MMDRVFRRSSILTAVVGSYGPPLVVLCAQRQYVWRANASLLSFSICLPLSTVSPFAPPPPENTAAVISPAQQVCMKRNTLTGRISNTLRIPLTTLNTIVTHRRYGLGIRRFRTGGSAGNGDGGRDATPTAVAAAAAAAASVANGGGGGGVGKRGGGERDVGAGGSVSKCFEQVPRMFFDKCFTLQVCFLPRVRHEVWW